MKYLNMILVALFLSCALNISAATVETPMVQDLDADGYKISNLADLITEGPWADVRAFGADPTGVSDSYTAFYNAATSGAGTVFVPKGTYRLNSPLSLGVNFIAEDGAVVINYYGTGTAITTGGSSYHTGRIISGFQLVSKSSGQNGILISGGTFVKARNIVIDDFDGIGLRVGVAGVSGVYFANISEIYCRNATVQGATGLLVDGVSIPNSNANTFTNVAVKGKWTTLFNIKGNSNLFLMGNAEVNTTGNGCSDVWKIEGLGNEINGCYYEMSAAGDPPDSIFSFTSTSSGNKVKNIYATAGIKNVYSYTDDQGWGNELSYAPLGWNFSFPVENKSVENLVSNSHFKYMNGNAPYGWTIINQSARESSVVRGSKYSLKMTGTSYANCYAAGHSSSISGLPIERFQGKTVVAGVWVKSTDSSTQPLKIWAGGTGYGGNTHTGDGTWQFITAMAGVPEDATNLSLQLRSNGTTYFSEPILVEGVHLPYPNPRPLNDGYARMAGPFIGSPFATFADGETTPDVSDGNHYKTANTLATTITDFTSGAAGQEITIVFGDANTTVSDAGNIKLSGAFTSTANDTLKILYDGTNWFEISRSVN